MACDRKRGRERKAWRKQGGRKRRAGGWKPRPGKRARHGPAAPERQVSEERRGISAGWRHMRGACGPGYLGISLATLLPTHAHRTRHQGTAGTTQRVSQRPASHARPILNLAFKPQPLGPLPVHVSAWSTSPPRSHATVPTLPSRHQSQRPASALAAVTPCTSALPVPLRCSRYCFVPPNFNHPTF